MNTKRWRTCVLAVSLSAIAGALIQAEPQSRTRSAAAGRGTTAYQVPAGTALLVTLRTGLDTSTSAPGDQVEGVLWSPVVQTGVELIPSGSVVTGTLVEVERATKRQPGAFTVAFSVVEHSETRSRATLPSRRMVLHATAEPEPVTEVAQKGREAAPKTVIPAGTAIVVTTSEPILVRIPR
jgi:hypothetical protein